MKLVPGCPFVTVLVEPKQSEEDKCLRLKLTDKLLTS